MLKVTTNTRQHILQFCQAVRHQVSRMVCSTLLLALAAPLPAADMLYVSLGNNTIVSFDTTGDVGVTIAATMSTFANTNLDSPTGLAFDSSGNLYAANYSGATISKFNQLGGYVSNISGISNLNGPRGLAFDTSGNLYAANYGGSTISKFNAAGVYVSNIATNLARPDGLAFDNSGNLYAANYNDYTISKFNASGAYLSNISSNYAAGLAFDNSGNLYAANQIGTINKFNASGGYINSITTNLSTPNGLAFDSSGNLYAANGTSKTISKFDSSGTFLTSWSTGSSPTFLAFKPVSVPEPSTYALATIATSVLAYLARRRKARTA
jgi:sugar lactone lactonase YvrE